MSLVMIDYFKLVALIARWIKIFFVIQELQWLGQTKLKNLRKQEWSYSVSILVFWLQLGWSAEVILCPKVEVILYSWNSLKIKNTKACLSRFFVFNCSRNLLVHCCSFNCKKLVFLFKFTWLDSTNSLSKDGHCDIIDVILNLHTLHALFTVYIN